MKNNIKFIRYIVKLMVLRNTLGKIYERKYLNVLVKRSVAEEMRRR